MGPPPCPPFPTLSLAPWRRIYRKAMVGDPGLVGPCFNLGFFFVKKSQRKRDGEIGRWFPPSFPCLSCWFLVLFCAPCNAIWVVPFFFGPLWTLSTSAMVLIMPGKRFLFRWLKVRYLPILQSGPRPPPNIPYPQVYQPGRPLRRRKPWWFFPSGAPRQ